MDSSNDSLRKRRKLGISKPYKLNKDRQETSGVAKPGPTRALARASAHLALASEIGDDHMINLYRAIYIHYSQWHNWPYHQPLWPTISISTYHVNSILYKTIGWLSMAGQSVTGHRLPI